MQYASKHDERLAAEIAKIREEEKQKRDLLDKSIGNSLAYRPTDKMIERDTGGPLKNETEIMKEAERRVWEIEKRELIALNQKADEADALALTTKRLERDGRAESPSARDYLKRENDEGPRTMRDRLEEMAKGVGRRTGISRADD